MLQVQTTGTGVDEGHGHRRGRRCRPPVVWGGGIGRAAPVWKRLVRFLSGGVRSGGGDQRSTRLHDEPEAVASHPGAEASHPGRRRANPSGRCEQA